MTLSARAPRELYRVYGEEEFLAGADWQGAGHAPGMPRSELARRLAVAALLCGAVGAAASAILLSCIGSAKGTGARRGERTRSPLRPPASAWTLVPPSGARARIWRTVASSSKARPDGVRRLTAAPGRDGGTRGRTGSRSTATYSFAPDPGYAPRTIVALGEESPHAGARRPGAAVSARPASHAEFGFEW